MYPKPFQRAPKRARATDTATATAADTVITYTASPALNHVIFGVQWSYSTGSAIPSDTAPGTLTVAFGRDGIVEQFDITSTGPGFMVFDPPLMSQPNDTATITLLNGGSGVVGKLNVQHETIVG